MCGISGFISSSQLNGGSLEDLTSIIRHRGPDDEGYALWEDEKALPLLLSGEDTPRDNQEGKSQWAPTDTIQNYTSKNFKFGFGHRRLSILDVSPLGHQPMSYDHGRYWITYNGEIYNYLELRDELETLNHRFLTGTDTEVILAAYAQWGEECLHRFNGMWAFAIYDSKKETIFLARDNYGIKPLYYWISPDQTFFFASEIKQFTQLPEWKAELNKDRAYDYLIWGITDHTDETLFTNVFQVPAGSYILNNISDASLFQQGRIASEKWYQIKNTPRTKSFQESAQEFKELLKKSVNIRLRSDVAIGSCLSGGLDSSSIVCLAARDIDNSGPQLNTLSALSDVETYNEEKWINVVKESTNINNLSTHPNNKDLFDKADLITWHQDEPFGSTSIYAQWCVFDLASHNNIKVVLDGQGADEQLLGYHDAFGVRLCSLFLSGRIIQLVNEAISLRRLHGYSTKRIAGQFFSVLLPNRLTLLLRNHFGKVNPRPDWIDFNFFSPDIEKKSKIWIKSRSIFGYCKAQMTEQNLQMLLKWEDRNSMAHSVESRIPFLDPDIVDFSMNIPDDFKLLNGTTKRILRESMRDIVPEAILGRNDKIGFATPEEHWVKNIAREDFRRKIEDSIIQSKGLLNNSCLSYFDDVIDGKKPFSFALWRIVNFGQWIKIFKVSV